MSCLVSVVIPAFESGDYLAEAVASALAQKVEGLQLVVVDDGSTRPAEPIVRSIDPSATVIRQTNRGPAAARNRGIAAASGRFIAFLDADDVWLPGALAAMLRGFRDAPGVQIVQGHVRDLVEAASDPASASRKARPARCSVHLGSCLIRRELFEEVGMFDPELPAFEDLDFHIRLRDRSIPRLIIPNVVLLYRRHAGSLTQRIAPDQPRSTHRPPPLRLLAPGRRRSAHTPPGAFNGGNPQPTVTAAIVVKNGARYLLQALASIETQTRLPEEILCVLGNSTDETAAILGSRAGLRVVRQAGEGLAAARNLAIAEAKTTHIAFLDHDDVWLPGKLQLQIDALACLAKPGISISNIGFFETGGVSGERRLKSAAPVRLGTTPSALLADRRVFAQIGGFDESMSFGCDGDWFARVLNSAIPVSVVNQAVTLKRRRPDSLGSRPDANRAEAMAIIARRRRRVRT